jgi:hypothetical protein
MAVAGPNLNRGSSMCAVGTAAFSNSWETMTMSVSGGLSGGGSQRDAYRIKVRSTRLPSWMNRMTLGPGWMWFVTSRGEAGSCERVKNQLHNCGYVNLGD